MTLEETLPKLPTLMDRLNVAIYELRQRGPHVEPAWIILGAEEWWEFRRSVDFRFDQPWLFTSDVIPQFRVVNIATVAVRNHLEVVPKVMYR